MSILVLLSPAKNQNFIPPAYSFKATKPRLQKETDDLIKILKTYEPNMLATTLKISQALGKLNYDRYQMFNPKKYTQDNASPCIWTFQGDAYKALDAISLPKKTQENMQHQLRILSGLYGVLRPLDLIQKYRLEMGAKLQPPYGCNLYEYWQSSVTNIIEQDSNNCSAIIDLSSKEYGMVLDHRTISRPIITIRFNQYRDNKLKNIGIFAKRARGRMTRFIISKVLNYQDIQTFNEDGYQFNQKLSSDNEWVFVTKKL